MCMINNTHASRKGTHRGSHTTGMIVYVFTYVFFYTIHRLHVTPISKSGVFITLGFNAIAFVIKVNIHPGAIYNSLVKDMSLCIRGSPRCSMPCALPNNIHPECIPFSGSIVLHACRETNTPTKFMGTLQYI